MADCSVQDCDRPHYARGWCKKHWTRWRAHNTTELRPPVPPDVLAWVEQILVERNVDGKVPLDIACDLLDDIAFMAGSVNAPRHYKRRKKIA